MPNLRIEEVVSADSRNQPRGQLLGRVDSNHRLPDPESGQRNFAHTREFWPKFKEMRGAGLLPTTETQVSFPRIGNPRSGKRRRAQVS